MAKYYTSTRFRPECPTCGFKLGQYEESFKRLQEQGKSPHDALEALGINRPCCRVRALWPIVLPLGGFYLPRHEAAILNYLGLKEPTPQPNLVILSLRRAVTGENFLISHVNPEGFIGKSVGSHEPTEFVIGEKANVVLEDGPNLTRECQVRVQTEPGEISRGFAFETRAFRRDIEVDRVKSYFDLPPEEEIPEEIEKSVEELMAAGEAEEEDEPLVAGGGEEE